MNKDQKKILIIEDEAIIRKVLSGRLKEEGFEVSEAEDGEQGFKMAKKLEPDLIMLDIIMPKSDGINVLKNIRSLNKYGEDVPIIMMTNLTPDMEISQKVAKYTPSYYFVKNEVKLDDVIIKIKELL